MEKLKVLKLVCMSFDPCFKKCNKNEIEKVLKLNFEYYWDGGGMSLIWTLKVI